MTLSAEKRVEVFAMLVSASMSAHKDSSAKEVCDGAIRVMDEFEDRIRHWSDGEPFSDKEAYPDCFLTESLPTKEASK